MHKLSTEQLLKIYKKASKCNVSKDFIKLLSEEINMRLIIESSYEGLLK
ncbi:sporulation histidine kinase inhibitor Sda [Neobacillus sp. 179-J 1A1 HS]